MDVLHLYIDLTHIQQAHGKVLNFPYTLYYTPYYYTYQQLLDFEFRNTTIWIALNNFIWLTIVSELTILKLLTRKVTFYNPTSNISSGNSILWSISNRWLLLIQPQPYDSAMQNASLQNHKMSIMYFYVIFNLKIWDFLFPKLLQ